MFVSERMSHPVITIHPNTSLQDAMHLMQVEHIRRLPVIDNHGKMVGIVTESDLLRASPSDVTTLSVWEMGYLLSKITIDKIMVREVIAVNENTPIEEAARIMADHKVGGLPVLRNGNLVGIITDTDLFKIFLELFGAPRSWYSPHRTAREQARDNLGDLQGDLRSGWQHYCDRYDDGADSRRINRYPQSGWYTNC